MIKPFIQNIDHFKKRAKTVIFHFRLELGGPSPQNMKIACLFRWPFINHRKTSPYWLLSIRIANFFRCAKDPQYVNPQTVTKR